MDVATQPPIFLGICFRAQHHQGQWDLLGVRDSLVAPFFPQLLRDQAAVFAVPEVMEGSARKLKLIFRDDKNAIIEFCIDVNQEHGISPEACTEAVGIAPAPAASPLLRDTKLHLGRVKHPQQSTSAYHLLAVPTPPISVEQPTRVLVEVEEDGSRHQIGAFDVLFQPPPPLSLEEREFLKALPGVKRSVHVNWRCRKCNDSITVFVSLSDAKTPKGVPTDAVRIDEAPDVWRCTCGNEKSLKYLKLGMHDLLRHPRKKGETTSPSFTPAYEHGAIHRILKTYSDLIGSSPDEEAVQQFLYANPIFWAFLGAVQIFPKPAVLTKKKADFAVLSATKILYLIEIEKPQTKLVKRNGGMHAQLQAPYNQIRDWLVVVEDHRNAFLDELGLDGEQVHDIRFIVVAGMAQNTPAAGLLRLRRTQLGAELYCFDELGGLLYMLSGALAFV